MPGGLSLSRQRGGEGLCWGLEGEGLAGSSVEFGGDGVELVLGAISEARLAWEVWAQETVGVLVAAALPGAARVAEEHRDTSRDGEPRVRGHLLALVPGQRPSQRDRQLGNLRGESFGDDICGVTGWESNEHDEAAVPLDEGRNRAGTLAKDQVAFPMARDCAVVGLGRSFTDVHEVADLALTIAGVLRERRRPSRRTLRAQIASQLLAQRAAGLHEQRLIDRLVRHAHLRIIGELAHQPTRDLLRRPAK